MWLTVGLVVVTVLFGGWKAMRSWLIALTVLIVIVVYLMGKNQCYTGTTGVYPSTDFWVSTCSLLPGSNR